MESAAEAITPVLQTDTEPGSTTSEREHYPGRKYSALAVLNAALQQVRGTERGDVLFAWCDQPLLPRGSHPSLQYHVTARCCTASGLSHVEVSYQCRSTHEIHTNKKQFWVEQQHQAETC